jgi:menaquinone-dependent protoporphyrinogen IX oxidase
VKHIYERNANMKDLVKDDSLMVSNRYFATDLEKGIESIRDEWRQKNEVAENATVIFFAPGNEHNEAEFATENVRRGVKEFLMKYSAPTSLSPKALPINNFVTVISLHSGSDGEKYVREYLKENEWYGKVIFVSD